jgi:hypothetical protein
LQACFEAQWRISGREIGGPLACGGSLPPGYLTTHRAECSSTAIKTFTVRDVGSSVFAVRGCDLFAPGYHERSHTERTQPMAGRPNWGEDR